MYRGTLLYMQRSFSHKRDWFQLVFLSSRCSSFSFLILIQGCGATARLPRVLGTHPVFVAVQSLYVVETVTTNTRIVLLITQQLIDSSIKTHRERSCFFSRRLKCFQQTPFYLECPQCNNIKVVMHASLRRSTETPSREETAAQLQNSCQRCTAASLQLLS